MPDSSEKFDICVVGGCGHVGLPLGLAFANAGKKVALYDINEASVKKVNTGEMPFMEEGADDLLKKALKSKKITATTKPEVIGQSKAIIMVTGTPVDEHLNPRLHNITNGLKEIEPHLRDDHLLVMRSTLYPGITDKVHEYLIRRGKKTLVSFCPERIAEGHALKEFKELPQIVSGCTPEAATKAAELFKNLSKEIITTKPIEAELGKLFTNTWRYINFAISNQFYMIANAQGLDFYNIYDAMTRDYPRLKSFAKAGLAAGPCLFKDTMQLSSFSGNNFFLGHAAMLVNEGLPDFIVDSMKDKYNLKHRVIGILGMAFKGNNDDPRESLSYKLKKKLEIEANEVLCHDPYVKDDRLVPLDEIKKRADIVLLAAPHSVYAEEDWADKDLIDMWDFYGQGGLI